MSDSANICPMVMSLRINKRHLLTAELAISAQVHLDYEQTVMACAKRVFLSALCQANAINGGTIKPVSEDFEISTGL